MLVLNEHWPEKTVVNRYLESLTGLNIHSTLTNKTNGLKTKLITRYYGNKDVLCTPMLRTNMPHVILFRHCEGFEET